MCPPLKFGSEKMRQNQPKGERERKEKRRNRDIGGKKRDAVEREREREERERPKGRREMTESGASVKEEEKTIQNDGINNMGKVRVGFRSHKSNILFAGLPSLNFFFQLN